MDEDYDDYIWAYDYGGRSRDRWPAKHDTILVYVKDPNAYHFDSAAVDREPYMAPGLVTPEKAERGKLPTDVWWHTIVPTSGRERTGYPTQKPLGILAASSRPRRRRTPPRRACLRRGSVGSSRWDRPPCRRRCPCPRHPVASCSATSRTSTARATRASCRPRWCRTTRPGTRRRDRRCRFSSAARSSRLRCARPS